MKRLSLLILALAATFTLQAQWVDDPINNNHIANSPGYCGEIFVSTDAENGDTYIQWSTGGSNGYGPTLQRLTFDGTPQWGDDGIRIMGQEFNSYSEGIGMAVTADHGVVSCFATANDQTVAVKINADGTYAWGEQGIVLFDGNGFSRAEVIAGDDGGVWTLGYDYQRLYLQYIKANGSTYPTTIVEAEGSRCQYGQLTLGIGNSVFLTYEKTPSSGSGFWLDKEIHLVGFTTDGVQIGPDVTLMSSQTFQVTYIHYVVPDDLGGAYAYIWHSGIGGSFNTYVFHYDANGFSTISDTNGIPVHSADPDNFYISASATVDPVSHDLLITYLQTDAYTQTSRKVYVNRITSSGERLWDEGVLVYDNGTNNCGGLSIDAFEDGSGFAVVYYKGGPMDDGRATVEAVGMDMNCNVLWNKQLCSVNYPKTSSKTSSGFHMGQNIVAWVNSEGGGIYGQNFAPDGTMGAIEPNLPCLAPENFEGEYVYDDETQTFGAQLTWTAPETQPLHYNLIRTDLGTSMTTEIEVPGNAVSYYDEVEMGNYMYQLTAVYENCESDYALSTDGEHYILLEVTGIEENIDEEIVTLIRIINANGQTQQCKDLNELTPGLYILQGTNKDGQMVNKKIIVNK